MRYRFRGFLLPVAVLAVALPALSTGRLLASTRVPAPPSRYLVLIVMDGFRPDYLALAPMPHLHTLMASGMTYTRAWVGQLETQTPTSHATLATGAYPSKHGVMGFVWRDPTGQNITWMPSDLDQVDAGSMERLIEAGGVPSISDVLHHQSPNGKSVSISGEKFYAADAVGVGADYILYGDSPRWKRNQLVPVPVGNHVPPASTHYRSIVQPSTEPVAQDTFAGRLAVQMLATTRPRILLLNLPGPDIEGHRSGGVANQGLMRDVAVGVDDVLGQIMTAYQQAGIYQRTDFVVVADHGMLPDAHIVARKAMYKAVRASGALWLEEDFLGTAGYVYLRDPRDTERVASLLARDHFTGVEGVLYKVRTPTGYSFRAGPGLAQRLGPDLTQAYIDLCNTFAAAAGPEIVLPFREDTMGLIVKGFQGHYGTHGGLSWRVQHIPLIISGPGVRHGVSAFPAQLTDVAPTAERLMGLPIPKGVDGVVLGDALDGATDQDRATQQAVRSARARDVSALLRHSQGQHAEVLSNQ